MRKTTKTWTVEDLMRLLDKEKQERNVAEQTANVLRKENARMAAINRTRTHYVILIPKPKLGVLKEVLVHNVAYTWCLFQKAGKALKEFLWPVVETD